MSDIEKRKRDKKQGSLIAYPVRFLGLKRFFLSDAEPHSKPHKRKIWAVEKEKLFAFSELCNNCIALRKLNSLIFQVFGHKPPAKAGSGSV